MASVPQLMLEGPEVEKGSWRNKMAEELIDALPYFDHEYEDAQYKDEVQRLIQEEMKRSVKKPASFLADLPPAPVADFSNSPMLSKEYDRIRAGKAPVTLDLTRYRLEEPPAHHKDDPRFWKRAVENAQAQMQHQVLKLENLELMLQYTAGSHRIHHQHLEAFDARLRSVVKEMKAEVETVNRDRQLSQAAVAAQLSKLESEWKQLVGKNMDIEEACQKLEAEVEGLREEAAVRSGFGPTSEPEMTQDKGVSFG